MYQEQQIYHIFKVRIEKQYYRIKRIFTDEEFDRVMELVHWRMPFNICAYHFLSGNPPVCTNPVVNALPEIDYSIEKLFSESVHGELKVRDKNRKQCRTVYKKWKHFVIAQDDIGNGEYGKLLPIDSSHTLMSDLKPSPITLKDAQKYVQKYHRHNDAPHGHKFSIALFSESEEEPVGVVIASIPKSRILAKDRYTLEINRCCTNSYYENACSKLYSLAIKAGKSMGYRKFITYTLETESGASLRAVGFSPDQTVPASTGWNTPSRPRKQPTKFPEERKIRWILNT